MKANRILDFFSNWELWGDEWSLCEHFDLFLKSGDSVSSLYYFSFPIDSKYRYQKQNHEYCRLLWCSDSYKSKEFRTHNLMEHKILRGIQLDLLMEAGHLCFIKKNRDYHYIYLGQFESQAYFLACYTATFRIYKSYLKFFPKFLKGGFQSLGRIRQSDNFKSLAYVDDVTGLSNQRKMTQDIDRAIGRFQRDGDGFCLLFIDIDHFKKVNDGHGHLIGTGLLVHTAKVILDSLRENDLSYRYGGDEFVVLLPSVTTEIAFIVGERILSNLKNHVFKFKNNIEIRLSVSIGVSEYPKDGKTREEIIELADHLMYKAKEGGRGQVKRASELVVLQKEA